MTSDIALSAALKHMDGAFSWDRRCCCRAAGLVFADLWGRNPVPPLSYVNARQAMATIAAGGGRDVYVNGLARDSGLRASNATPGAIGLVETHHAWGWALGICVDAENWAVKGDVGVRFFPSFIRAWTV